MGLMLLLFLFHYKMKFLFRGSVECTVLLMNKAFRNSMDLLVDSLWSGRTFQILQ